MNPPGYADDAPSTGLGVGGDEPGSAGVVGSPWAFTPGRVRCHRPSAAYIARGEPAGLRDDALSTGLGGRRRQAWFSGHGGR
ncbi:MAG: hypothetical protein R2854_06275 [Caldilineaceae bacterium]